MALLCQAMCSRVQELYNGIGKSERKLRHLEVHNKEKAKCK